MCYTGCQCRGVLGSVQPHPRLPRSDKVAGIDPQSTSRTLGHGSQAATGSLLSGHVLGRQSLLQSKGGVCDEGVRNYGTDDDGTGWRKEKLRVTRRRGGRGKRRRGERERESV